MKCRVDFYRPLVGRDRFLQPAEPRQRGADVMVHHGVGGPHGSNLRVARQGAEIIAACRQRVASRENVFGRGRRAAV